MRKMNPFDFTETKTNEEIIFPQGRLWVRLSAPAPIYVTLDGIETLVSQGHDTEVDLKLSQEGTFRIDAEAGVRAFIYNPHRVVFEPAGEIFTNTDRMPHESGTMAEINGALRRFKLEQRMMLKEIQQEREALEAGKQERAPVAPETQVKPGDEPETPEPDDEPETPPEPAPKAKAKEETKK